MGRKATVILMLFMMAGCLPSADPFVIQEKKIDNSLLKNIDESIEGMLHLKINHEMLVMEVLEMAPHNVGRENKKCFPGRLEWQWH